MASWNDTTPDPPDPDILELSKIASGAKDISAGTEPLGDNLRQPASSHDYNINHLDASDFTDDLTGAFDGQTGLPRQ